MRSRRHAGFTLVELMVVVAIICVIGAVAARMYSGGVRGETAPAFARSAMSVFGEARHMAVALGKRTYVKLTASTTGKYELDTYSYEPTTSTWTLQGSLKVPSTLQLCTSVAQPQLGTSAATPSCPLSTTQPDYLCFFTTGKVALSSTGNCTTEAANGATVYLETMKADKKYKLVIWGLTGMTKVMDQW